MKRALLLIILLLSLAGFGQQGHWRPGEMEVKVGLSGAGQAKELASLNLNGDIYTASGYAILYLIPEELEKVRSAGFTFEILKPDLNSYSRDFWQNNRDAYHSYDEIIQLMNSLSFGHPDICRKYDLGFSVEGRLLSALKISDNVAVDEDEPEVMFDGGIHGDEIGGPENLIRFAQFLCDSYGVDPDVTDLIDNREIWLYVMVNPDGRVNMVRYNSNGIDVNRDWGYMWNAEGGSPGYYSQVETKTLRDCMLDNQFVVHTSYHSGTEMLSYPWSYRPDACPDQAHIDALAALYSSTSGYANLPYAQGYQGMYPINGSSKDAYYGIMGSVGWTIEISNNKQPPSSQIQYYFDINKPAMLAMIENSAYGISGVVTDALTGAPIPATIFVNDFYPYYTDPVVGDYHKYLLAGDYQVTATANGYQAATLPATVYSNTATIVNFSLQPQYNYYAYRVGACAIPDNNFDDEGTTFAALWAPDGARYSIGRSGWIVLDMGESVLDGPGSELKVYEDDNDPEGYSCYAGQSIDGPWTFVGTGTGSTVFNFTPVGITEARYIRIVDDGNGSASGNNAGFDLDAVEALQQPPVILLVMDARISDPLGNNNGRIDPGETADLVITLRNHGGMTASDLLANLNFDSTYVSFSVTDTLAGDIAHGDQVELIFPFTCDPATPLEQVVMMVLNLTANNGTFTESYPLSFTVGAIIEDWETNGFGKFDWTFGGNMPWAINFLSPYEGSYCAKSGNIDDGQTSALQIIYDVIGYDDISFYRKVSSEPGMDFLRFYIDGVLMDEWSGNSNWEYVSYQVRPGTHIFKWAYEKNEGLSMGYDGGYIDYIVFPSGNLSGSLNVIANAWPFEFCGTGTSQLGAYVIGGTGDYTYSWSPTGGLSNPDIQFPEATPLGTTVYQVTVNDGQNSLAANIQVTLHPIPGLPVVIQQGDSLISSATEGNQWYNSSGIIEGATGQVLYPPVQDYYHVVVTSEFGCVSEPSEPIYFLFTLLEDRTLPNDWCIFPNPVKDIIFIQRKNNPNIPVNISLKDVTGKALYTMNGITGGIITVPAAGLSRGIYILFISDDCGKSLNSYKIIK